jgi:O-succinylbenzoate synthase
MKIDIEERTLHFKQPAGTSRGVYTERKVWYVTLSDGDRRGVGECAPLPDLSCDAMSDEAYEKILRERCETMCRTGEIPYDDLRDYPSMLFGIETAWLSLKNGDRLFDTKFSQG